MPTNPNVYVNNGSPLDESTVTGNTNSQDLLWGGTFGGLPWLQSLWGDITGSNAEMRGYQMQEYFQDKQNEYNTPVEQLKRYRAAGINDAQAAQAILGAGSESAQAPGVSPVGTNGAAGIQAAASMIQSASQSKLTDSQAELNKANAGKAAEEAIDLKETRSARLAVMSNQATSLAEKAGLDRASSTLLGFKIVHAGDVEWYNMLSTMAQFERLTEEIANIQTQGKILKQQLTQEEYQNWYNGEVEKAYVKTGAFPDQELYNMLEWAKANGHYSDMVSMIYDYHHNMSVADYSGDPYNEEYRQLYDYRNELMDRLAECKDIIKEAKDKVSSGDMSQDDFNELYNKVSAEIKSLHEQIDDADDMWHDTDYSHGHTKQWQDLLNSLLPLGLGSVVVGAGRIGKGVKRVKGYGK